MPADLRHLAANMQPKQSTNTALLRVAGSQSDVCYAVIPGAGMATILFLKGNIFVSLDMFRIRLFSVLLLGAGALISCKKDEPIQTQAKPALNLVFEPTVNSEPFVADTKWYTNFSNDSFTVSKFNYYISNIKLKKSDGSSYAVPESYYLLQHVEGINSIALKNLPEGDFIGVDFLIGVDSLRNTSGSQTGDLDPSKNMFWDWNTGYIFYKLEGRFTTLTNPVAGDYAMHIGGYKGKDNCIQACSFSFNSALQLRKEKLSKVYFKVRVEEVFQNPLFIDFDYYYATLPNNNSKEISENYRDMFLFYKLEN